MKTTHSFPYLHTQRLTLRPMMIQDAEAVFALRADKEVAKYLDRPLAETLDDAIQHIQMIEKLVAQKKVYFWAISLTADDSFLGTICLWEFDWAQASAEVGYELLSKYRQQGFVQEAMEALLPYAFENLKLAKITAHVHPDNQPSIQFLVKNNFQLATDTQDYYYLSSDSQIK